MPLVDDNALAMLLGLGGIKTGLPAGPRLSTNIEAGPANLLPGEAPMFTPGPMANDPSFGMSYSPPLSAGTAANSSMAQGAGVNDVETAAARGMMHQPTEKVWRDLPPPAPYSGPALTPTGTLAPSPQGIMSDPATMIPQALGQKVSAQPSDFQGPFGGAPYTPLTPEEQEALGDTGVVSSKGPNGGPTKEEVQEMLDTSQEDLDAHYNDLVKDLGKDHVLGGPLPAGRIRGWKSIPGFQEYMKNLPPDVTVHDLKDGTIIFQKVKQKPVPTS